MFPIKPILINNYVNKSSNTYGNLINIQNQHIKTVSLFKITTFIS